MANIYINLYIYKRNTPTVLIPWQTEPWLKNKTHFNDAQSTFFNRFFNSVNKMNEQRSTLFVPAVLLKYTKHHWKSFGCSHKHLYTLYLLGQNDYQLAEDVDEIQEQINWVPATQRIWLLATQVFSQFRIIIVYTSLFMGKWQLHQNKGVQNLSQGMCVCLIEPWCVPRCVCVVFFLIAVCGTLIVSIILSK